MSLLSTSALLRTLEVLQLRVPSFEAVLSSGWPLFGMRLAWFSIHFLPVRGW